MSVINKMLLDLDARQEPAAGDSKDAGSRLLKGTAGISGPWAAKLPARSLPWLTGLLVLVVAAAAAWYVFELEDLLGDKAQPLPVVFIAPKPQPAPASVAAPVPEVSLPIVTATTSVRSDAALPALTPAANVAPPAASVLAPAAKAPLLVPAATPRPPLAAPPTQPKIVTSVPVQSKLAASGSASEKPPGSAMSVLSDAAVPASPPKTAVAPSLVARPSGPLVQGQAAVVKPATASGPSTSPPIQSQRAARETLAHAQGLWAAGSHGAALDLMRQSVAAAERAYQAGTLTAGSPELASLVRELARMDLAEGRVSRVLEMLTRLEPALAGHADLWAVRGNAAQRLARHEESVHAYLQALELRPGESRWMLGAAVSLAALGRLEAAAEQAERARAMGVVSPDILAYLRQAGVPLK